MNAFTHRLALLGLGLVMLALTAALALAVLELLPHLDLGRFGLAPTRSALPGTQAQSTRAVLVEGLSVFESLAQSLTMLAVLAGVLVLPVIGLALLGVGGVCFYGSVVGLPEHSARPVAGVVPLLRKLRPALSA